MLFIAVFYHWLVVKLFLSQGVWISALVPGEEFFFWLSCDFRLFVCLRVVFNVGVWLPDIFGLLFLVAAAFYFWFFLADLFGCFQRCVWFSLALFSLFLGPLFCSLFLFAFFLSLPCGVCILEV